MSFYNMLFGMNSQSDLLLAVIGLRKNDVERFRDCHVSEDGKTICVYTRTGGNNREDYQNIALRHATGWRSSVDDDFDNTYCTDYFDIPAEFVTDIANLSDIMKHGMRAEFSQHLAKTMCREPTESDTAAAAYQQEAEQLKRTRHFMANGHTFVPQDDASAEIALKLAEANGGKLRSCWGIMPLAIEVKRDFYPYPNAKDDDTRKSLTRVDVSYAIRWEIDTPYWQHMQERWASKYPLTMAEIAKSIQSNTKAA